MILFHGNEEFLYREKEANNKDQETRTRKQTTRKQGLTIKEKNSETGKRKIIIQKEE
jgi:hypothetical protein